MQQATWLKAAAGFRIPKKNDVFPLLLSIDLGLRQPAAALVLYSLLCKHYSARLTFFQQTVG